MGEGRLVPRTCDRCGSPFETPERGLRRGRGRFCSRKCSTESAQQKRWADYHANPESFWVRVDKSAGMDGCWPWTGVAMKKRGGYGRLVSHGKHVGSHRMALTLACGADEEGKFACHHCDNPICCNPRHLFWGTHQDNMDDRAAKGRSRGAPALIDLQHLLARHSAGLSYSKLALEFGVGQASIGKALKRAALRALANQEPSDAR